jgi:hypothetical protein
MSEEKEKVIFILTVGTPAEGFSNYGPFESSEEATSWAETNIEDDPWWVDTLMLAQIIPDEMKS